MVTAAKAAASLTSPTRSSLFISVRSGTIQFLVRFSTTCVRKLSSVLSWDLLDCLCFCVASPANDRVVKGPHKNQGLRHGGCFRKPQQLLPLVQAACNKHPQVSPSQ